MKKKTKPATKAEARTQRLDARERIKQARTIAKEAKRARREALREVRATIARARRELPKRIKMWREVNRQILRRAIEGERHAARADAVALKTGTMGRAHELIERANKQIDDDLKHLRWLGKHRHQPVKSSARVAAGLRAAELRAERDEFTRAELPEEMHAAWEAHKHKIKAGPRSTRWEAALDYFHNHPELVIEANERALEASTRALIEREHEERARLENRPAPKKKRAAKKLELAKKLKPPKKSKQCTHPRAVPSKRVPGMVCPDCGAVFRKRAALADVPF